MRRQFHEKGRADPCEVYFRKPFIYGRILVLRFLRNVLKNRDLTRRVPPASYSLTATALKSHDKQHPHAVRPRLARRGKNGNPLRNAEIRSFHGEIACCAKPAF